MSAPLPTIRGLRVASPDELAALGVVDAGAVLDDLDSRAERLVTAGEFEPADDPSGWWVRWRGALTVQWRRLDGDQVGQQVTLGRMRPDAAAPLTADELAAVLTARAARVERTPSVVSVEAAVAPRFPGRFEFWIDRDGVLCQRSRMADPVHGGTGSAPPPPDLTQRGERLPLLERWRRRNDPVGEPVTAAWLEAVALSSGLLAHGERPDWEEVVAELRALVTAP